MIIQLGVCKRCGHRAQKTRKQVCEQCHAIATMIVESCAMNLATIPVAALEDADCTGDILAAVRAAREAFVSTGMTTGAIERLRQKLSDNVAEDIVELDQSKKES